MRDSINFDQLPSSCFKYQSTENNSINFDRAASFIEEEYVIQQQPNKGRDYGSFILVHQKQANKRSHTIEITSD